MFNLMYEMGWRSEPFDLDDWVANYTTRRYGCTMERPCNTAIGAWHLLQVAQPLTIPTTTNSATTPPRANRSMAPLAAGRTPFTTPVASPRASSTSALH